MPLTGIYLAIDKCIIQYSSFLEAYLRLVAIDGSMISPVVNVISLVTFSMKGFVTV